MPLFGPPNIEKLKEKRDVNGLIKLTLGYQEKKEIRINAAKALGELKDPRAVIQLIAEFKDENDDKDVRIEACRALASIGDPRALEILIAGLKDENKFVQAESAEALGILGDARAVEPLVALLHVKVDFHVHWSAEKGLVNLGAPAVEPLIAVLKDGNKDDEVRGRAACTLGDARDTRAVEPLIAALGEGYYVRLYAAEALGKIGDTRAVEPLISVLEDRKSIVREKAAEALRRFNWQPGLDENRARYWIALGQVDKCIPLGVLAVRPLIDALDQSDQKIVRKAADLLGQIGDVRAVEPLIAALKTLSCTSAARALDKLGWQPGQDENGACYWIGMRNWNKCKALGPIAVAPLLNALSLAQNNFSDIYYKEKVGAIMEVLFDLYESGQLDEENKKLIYSNCVHQTRPHMDTDSCSDGHTDIAPRSFPL